MRPTRDSRGPERPTADTIAVTGGNDTKEPMGSGPERSGEPRSWRQYIEQSMPPDRDAGAEEKREDAGVVLAGSGLKEEVRALWDRFSRWTQENGGKARSEAAAALEKLTGAVAGGLEKLGRGTEKVRAAVARHPISPLLYVTLIAVGIGVMAFQGNYARAYVLEVNGQTLGLVSGKDEVNTILGNVETRAASLLGGGFDYDPDVSLSPVYAAPAALSDAAEMEDVLFGEVEAYAQAYAIAAHEAAYMWAWAISVDGVELGYAADSGEFYRMLDEIAQPYIPADAVRYAVVEDVQVYPVELPSDTEFEDLEPIREELSAMRVEQAVYVVKKGDTFNAIAYSLGMTPNELSILNPDVMVNLLWIDQELIIQQAVPRLSVRVFTNETYEQVIPSPVEYIETPDLYVGDTRVKEQGEDGLALINAAVTYVNGVEMEREILESTALKEPTTTYTYTGTTPRPVTASNGYFIWPVRGTITSNFGGRYLYGRYDYHLGIDIACPTGTAVKAADGGTVTKAGWNGSYGYLVAIRHDNGMVTYYGHNSSILVSVGQKVYQGQIIARSGATGNVTGPHCHFEIRVNGTSVNPRNYL